jgi:hypothetical protein
MKKIEKTNQVLTEVEIFVCECHSFEHQVKFMYDDEGNMLYVYIHLTKDTFWARLKKGIKYIFGHSSRFGEWDEFIFQEKDEVALRDFLNQIKRKEDEDPLP